MEKGRERFFHPDRGTAAPDVSGRRKQLPDGNQIGFLVARNAGGSFQIDLVISRDDTDEMARPVTTKHERLENRSNIFAELFGHVSRGQMLLIHPIRDQFVGDFGSVEQTGRISGNKKADLIPVRELLPTTGYIRGGCSPIGINS